MDSGVLAAIITGGCSVVVAGIAVGINAFWLKKYLDEKFDHIDEKFDGIDKRLEKVEEKVTSIDKRVAILEDRAGRLVTEVHP